MGSDEKRILLLNWIGYDAEERSIGQAIREAGITAEELDRTYVERTPRSDGDYELWLVVRPATAGGSDG